MSTDVVTVPATGTVREVTERLLTEDVGSVIVTSEEGNPVGIVTESDALRACHEVDASLADVGVDALSHRPLLTTDPSATVSQVARRMADKDVKKAPVMDDLDLVGVITMTDIVWHLSEIRKEASDLGEAHSRWNPN